MGSGQSAPARHAGNQRLAVAQATLYSSFCLHVTQTIAQMPLCILVLNQLLADMLSYECRDICSENLLATALNLVQQAVVALE